MYVPRPAIPEPMKREVRQRCGFGCVFDGNPVIDYEHMEPYAVVKEHTAANITLLCPACHREKTAGRLSEKKVRAADSAPFCRKSGYTAPFVWEPELDAELTLKIGGNWFEYPGRVLAVAIDEKPIVELKRGLDGEVLLFLALFDRYNNESLIIDDNHLIINSQNWDVQFVGSTLTVRSASGVIALRLEYKSDEVLITHGDFRFNGIHVEVNPNGIRHSTPEARRLGTVSMEVLGSLLRLPVGLAFGRSWRLPSVGYRSPPIDRYYGHETSTEDPYVSTD